jgi:plastocyanin
VEQMVDISLLPKEEKPKEESITTPASPKKEKMPKPKGTFPTKFLIIGIVIVLLVAGATFGIFIYKNILSSNLKKVDNQVLILQDDVDQYSVMEVEAKTLQSQLKNLNTILNKHTYWYQVIKSLADYTPNDINYKSIVFDQKENKFTVTGYSVNYQTIAQLMVSLKNADNKKYFDKIELDSAKFNKDKGKIEFSVSLKIKEGALSAPLMQTTQTQTISITNQSFEPAEIKIKVGTEVIFKNNDSQAHTVTSKSFDSGKIDPNKEYKLPFTQKGTFDYYCSIHPTIKGKIIVE